MAVSSETTNDLMAVFSNTVTSGFAALVGPVNGIFGLMIALVVALTGIQWAVSSNRDALAGAFSKILLIIIKCIAAGFIDKHSQLILFESGLASNSGVIK
jgi:hypothetical protein